MADLGSGSQRQIEDVMLILNDRNVLTHAGKISHEMAKELAEVEDDKFNRQRMPQANAGGGEFEKAIKQLPPPPKPKNLCLDG